MSESKVMSGAFVFAYGSNLDSQRMKERVPSAEVVGTSSLPLHTLRFHKRSSRDSGGRADAFLTHLGSDKVLGVIYRISADELSDLDGVEGRPGAVDEVVGLVDLQSKGLVSVHGRGCAS